MEVFKQYLVPCFSNVAAVLILLAAFWNPKLARLLFVLLFGRACWMNYTTSHNNPEYYLSYASITPFAFYRDFINGWFGENITVMITLISFGQFCIAIGMMLNGWWVRLACIGAIIFLMSIAQLCVGSAFPFSITASLAAYFILRKDDLSYLWKFKKQNNEWDGNLQKSIWRLTAIC